MPNPQRGYAVPAPGMPNPVWEYAVPAPGMPNPVWEYAVPAPGMPNPVWEYAVPTHGLGVVLSHALTLDRFGPVQSKDGHNGSLKGARR